MKGEARYSSALLAAVIPVAILFTVHWDANQAGGLSFAACPTIVGHVPKSRPPRSVPRRGDIVFVAERTGASEIFVVNPASRAQARVTRRTPSGTDTAWSPDGTTIVFDRLGCWCETQCGRHGQGAQRACKA